MKPFMDEDFLLTTDTAKTLYHQFAESLPIIDYHCHVSPREIAEDKRYQSITEVWLGGDHYKWRAIRSFGVDEKYVTGDASAYEKFRTYATVMPKLIGNPLYHWSHLELKRYFVYEGALSLSTCDEVWDLCNRKLAEDGMSVRGLIRSSGVEALCTTDDPIDSLEWHKQLASDDSFPVRVLPAFRPDKGINCERAGYPAYIASLAAAAGTKITDLESLLAAYKSRLDTFDALGCRTADHGLDIEVPFAAWKNLKQVDDIFHKALAGEEVTTEEANLFRTYMLVFFAGEYKKRGWIMQIHFGPLRNVNARQFKTLGPDTGFDVISGRSSIRELACLLDKIDSTSGLPKTILYSINPTDNAALGALIGAFQSCDGTGTPTIFQGSAWWFNDNIAGMRDQLISFANLSALGNFPGMLTDSRSFLSYTRHEYFRRIVCDLIGGWVEDGLYPLDWDELGDLIRGICYENTKNLFFPVGK